MAIQLLDIPEKCRGYIWESENIKKMSASHRHKELEVNLVLNGYAEYILEERRYKLVPRSIVWLFPGQEHILSNISDDFTMFIAVFKDSLLSDEILDSQKHVLRQSNPPGELTFCKVIDQNNFEKVQNQFSQCLEDIYDLDLFNSGLKYLMFKCWAAYTNSSLKPEFNRFHPSVRKALSLIREFKGNIEIDELAHMSGLSRFQLSRLFKKQTGTSLCQMKNNYKLERYLELRLLNPQLTLLYSSLEAGFGSYAQFHRIYKNHFGHSPRKE